VGDPGARLDDFVPPTATAHAALDGARLTLTAEAEDNDRVASVTYLIDRIPVGTASATPYTVTLDSARLLARGSHSLTALVLDPSGNPGGSAPVAFDLANPYQQILANPGLEVAPGIAGWNQAGAPVPARRDSPGVTAHGGQGYALFYAPGQRLWQEVTLPTGAASATLAFWCHISGDTQGPSDATLTVSVKPASGETPAPAVLTLTHRDAREDWVRRTLDLGAFAGRRVVVSFALDTAQASPLTRFRVDDITLVCGDAPVAVAVTPALLALAPGAASDPLAATVTGSTDTAVTWSIRETDGGSLDADRHYTAPARPGLYHAVATAHADPLATGETSILVLPDLRVSPASANLQVGGSIDLALESGSSTQGVVLSLQEGSKAGTAARTPGTDTVVYTAPNTPGTYHLVVSDPLIASRRAVVTLVVVLEDPLVFRPRTLDLATGAIVNLATVLSGGSGVRFTLTEGEAGGTVSAVDSGPDSALWIYTAPSVPGEYHVVATSEGFAGNQATLTVRVQNGLVIDPPRPVAAPGQTVTFSVTVPDDPAPGVEWEVPPSASITEYASVAFVRAPSESGTYVVTAKTTQDPIRTVSAILTVKAADSDGDGRTAKDFGDLAAMADAYGTTAGSGQTLATDLNGDGQVDDDDLAEALAVFEQPGGKPPSAPAGSRRTTVAPLDQ
jgi:hypothetical protein